MHSSPDHSAAAYPRLAHAGPEPVFNAPWEAKAFAMVNQLAADKHYTWSEWTQYLVETIAATEEDTPGLITYYEQWVMACETLLRDKGLIDAHAINAKIDELLAQHETEHHP